jgi:hypothetical protein
VGQGPAAVLVCFGAEEPLGLALGIDILIFVIIISYWERLSPLSPSSSSIFCLLIWILDSSEVKFSPETAIANSCVTKFTHAPVSQRILLTIKETSWKAFGT